MSSEEAASTDNNIGGLLGFTLKGEIKPHQLIRAAEKWSITTMIMIFQMNSINKSQLITATRSFPGHNQNGDSDSAPLSLCDVDHSISWTDREAFVSGTLTPCRANQNHITYLMKIKLMPNTNYKAHSHSSNGKAPLVVQCNIAEAIHHHHCAASVAAAVIGRFQLWCDWLKERALLINKHSPSRQQSALLSN